ncbi:MAG: winged helix-turn-helix transcriptional regulator [Reichenbachiella sp.]
MKSDSIETFDIDSSILPWLGKTMKALDIYISDEFAKYGIPLTKAQLILLRRLSINNGIPQNNLAFITNRDKTSLTRLINTMEKKGYVSRRIDKKDKRINLIYITKEGSDVFEKAFPILAKINGHIEKGIGSDQLLNTILTLKKISKNINADHLTASLTQSTK